MHDGGSELAEIGNYKDKERKKSFFLFLVRFLFYFHDCQSFLIILIGVGELKIPPTKASNWLVFSIQGRRNVSGQLGPH